MKRSSRFCSLISMLLVLSIAMSVTAMADFEKYTDTDHWAKEYLRRAVEEGLLDGFGDNTLRPNNSINYSQALKILCCVLEPVNAAQFSDLGLTGYEWYADSSIKAKALGLTFDKDSLRAGNPITRAEAFRLLTDAFQLVPAEFDDSVLNTFADGDTVPAEYRGVFSALVSGGYVEGSSGKLNPLSNIKRAEFLAVLYRIITATTAGAEMPGTEGGVLVTDTADVRFTQLNTPLWIGCSAESASLTGVTAGTVVFRSQKTNLSLSGGSIIDRLVIAGGTGQSLNISTGLATVDTLVLGDGAPQKLTISGGVRRLEVTGDNLDITIHGEIDELVVSGTGCKVVAFSSVNSVRLTKESRGCSAIIYAFTDDLTINGRENSVTLNSTASKATLAGHDCSINGYGYASKLTLVSSTGTHNIRHTELKDEVDHGLSEAEVTLTAPETLPVGEKLTVTAAVTNPTPIDCTAVWTLNGAEIYRGTASITKDGTQLTAEHSFQYTEDMAATADVTLTLTYTSANDETTTVTQTVTVNIENYPPDYYEITAEEALSLVTSTYTGDKTLQWALDNDYEDKVKVAWINATGHASNTEYIVWINRTYQRVNVFTGSQGNWELEKSFLCGTGAPGTGTPVGVYTVFNRSQRGWITGKYCCNPVVNFKVGSGYAFHSRLYTPDRSGFVDDSIGFPVSAGCVRMYDEDVQWIFDNIPNDTTVVVH